MAKTKTFSQGTFSASSREGFGRLAWKEASTNEQRVQRLLDDQKRDNVTSSVLESVTSKPSVLRKQILFHRHHSEKVTLCLLNAGKVLGESSLEPFFS